MLKNKNESNVFFAGLFFSPLFRRQSAQNLKVMYTTYYSQRDIIDIFSGICRKIDISRCQCAAAAENMKLYDWIVFYSGKFFFSLQKKWNTIVMTKRSHTSCVCVCAFHHWCERNHCRRQVSDNEIALPPVDFFSLAHVCWLRTLVAV